MFSFQLSPSSTCFAYHPAVYDSRAKLTRVLFKTRYISHIFSQYSTCCCCCCFFVLTCDSLRLNCFGVFFFFFFTCRAGGFIIHVITLFTWRRVFTRLHTCDFRAAPPASGKCSRRAWRLITALLTQDYKHRHGALIPHGDRVYCRKWSIVMKTAAVMCV